jgi:predicted DNA-binding protein with PD1-like motif
MRSLRQPGPRHPSRIDCFRGDAVRLHYTLEPNQSLGEAIAGPLAKAGFQSATVTLKDAQLNPFRYVMPGPADDASHVAYFTAPRAPDGTTRIEQANATFGWAADKPSIHCHAVWVEPDGQRRGGHILPNETIVAARAEAVAWGFRDVRIEATADAETNFSLFQPSQIQSSGGPSGDGRSVVARIKPNEDILTALETIAREAGIRDGRIRGSLGSLIGATFANGGCVDDVATEVLVREGHIRDGIAALDMLVVDMAGSVHEGWLRKGENPVLITFDIVLEPN